MTLADALLLALGIVVGLYAGLIDAPGLMLRASIDLIGVAEPYTRERLDSGMRLTLLNVSGPGCQSVCRRPRQERPHGIHLPLDGCTRLQYFH